MTPEIPTLLCALAYSDAALRVGVEPDPKKAKNSSSTNAQEVEGSPSPASGGAAGSGGASADKSKQATLMISNTPPFRPRTPTQEEITSGTATSVRSYYVQKLKAYVDYHFADFLHTDPEVRLRHPLYASTCPKIEATTAASGAKWKPTSIMEPMSCLYSLPVSVIIC